MIRGTTAQFKFNLPYKAEEISLTTITFWQPGNNSVYLPITKTDSNCSVSKEDPYCLCVSLGPEETIIFSDKLKAKVQLRAQYKDTYFASRQQTITVYPINEATIGTPLPEPDSDGWTILDGETIV